MVDYKKHREVLCSLKKDQDVEDDNRESHRSAIHFLNKKDGQWEPSIVSKMTNRPRYTFDKCNPIVDQIMGEIEQADFDISILPGSMDSSKSTARVYNGMIRNIESISNAKAIYDAATRIAVSSGMDGWRIVHDWSDHKSMDMDLFIQKVHNYVDRVFFDCTAEEQTMSDAEHVHVLHPMDKNAYMKEYPKGSGIGVDTNRSIEVYTYKKEIVMIGELLFKKYSKKTIVQMTNGAVYEVDDKFEMIKDDLAKAQITVHKDRQIDMCRIMSQFYDDKDFLSDPEETVFSYLPIIPIFGNFMISEDKVIYWGAVEKLMDPQRVYNYSASREVEEGALSPRGKYWMTKKQAAGHEDKLKTLNINADPVQFYNHVEGVNAPFFQGTPQVNPALASISQRAREDLTDASGLYHANMGDNPGLQTGVAIERLQNKGDNGTYKYFNSKKIALWWTATVIIDAIPRVYDTPRQVRILSKDMKADIIQINTNIKDERTGRVVELNNLAKGKYEVVCTVGPAFQNKQQETVKAISDLAIVDPTIIAMGADVLLNNINAPDINLIAERKRMQMLAQGLIPESQMTEEERQMVQQMQEAAANQPPSPMEQALMAQAKAETEKAQANTADIISKTQERSGNLQIKQMQIYAKLRTDEQRNHLQAQQIMEQMRVNQERSQIEMQKFVIEQRQALDQQLKVQADTLNLLRSAIGADAIVSPEGVSAFAKQTKRINETQQ